MKKNTLRRQYEMQLPHDQSDFIEWILWKSFKFFIFIFIIFIILNATLMSKSGNN